jgi:hypothetical protein
MGDSKIVFGEPLNALGTGNHAYDLLIPAALATSLVGDVG